MEGERRRKFTYVETVAETFKKERNTETAF